MGNDGCPCDTGHLPELYEDQIQHNIDHGGQQQKIHGGTAVANGAENGRKGIIGELEYEADAVNAEIEQCVIQNGGVGL